MTWRWKASGLGGAGGGGAPAKAAAVQPLSIDGIDALGAWNLMATVFAGNIIVDVADYSGNGHPMKPINPVFIPDLIPGKQAFANLAPWVTGPASSLDGFPGQLGACTATVRFFNILAFSSTLDQWLVTDGRYNDVNTTFSLLAGASGNNSKLTSYHRFAPGVECLAKSTLSPIAGWNFASFARAADALSGEFGLNGVYETVAFSPSAPPTGGGGPVSIAGHEGQSYLTGTLAGSAPDVRLWPAQLSSAQCEVLRAIAMGL